MHCVQGEPAGSNTIDSLALLYSANRSTHNNPHHCWSLLRQERRELEQDGRHFSYFAFEGATGAMRWMHEVGCSAA